MTILLLEQNVRNALTMCDRGYVLENGRIIKEGKAKELMRDPHIQKAYLRILKRGAHNFFFFLSGNRVRINCRERLLRHSNPFRHSLPYDAD